MKRKTFLISLILLMVTGGLLSLYYLSSDYKVVLTESGFQPAELKIRPGETVIFSTKLTSDFWPASNLHPSHTAHPDFDPKQPVRSGDTWSYTFVNPGEYKFHDHLNPVFTGVIKVLANDGQEVFTDCKTDKNPGCWEELIIEIIQKQGLEQAFAILTELSDTEPEFLKDCHSYSHLIGEEAYQIYSSGGDFKLSPATALCGFGFYHGFMETLLLTSGDVSEARQFCSYVDKQVGAEASSAITACYHGTGHGAVDGYDPTTWGDVDAMMKPGFDLCEKVAINPLQKYLCHTGVFNAIDVLSQDPKYLLSAVQETPFETVCHHQPKDRIEGCYTNMVPVVVRLSNDDLYKAAHYINEHMLYGDLPTIDGYSTNEMVTIGLFVEFIRLHGQEADYMEKGTALCRAQPEEDRLACFAGLSAGHVKYGLPGEGYKKNLEFCAYEGLAEDEKDACYGFLLPRLRGQYSETVSKEICLQAPDAYRAKYCAVQ